MSVAVENCTATVESAHSVLADVGHELTRDDTTGAVRVKPSTVQRIGRHRRTSKLFGRR